MRNLNDRQRRFVELITEGKEQVEAYKQAGYKPKTKAAAEASASQLLSNPKCQEYLRELREKAEEASTWSKAQALDTLKGIAEDGQLQTGARVSAIGQAARMLGWNEPEQVEVQSDGLTALLESIRQKRDL